MPNFNMTAQEIAGWLPVIAVAGVLIETTVRGIREDRKKKQAKRPQKTKKNGASYSVSKPA